MMAVDTFPLDDEPSLSLGSLPRRERVSCWRASAASLDDAWALWQAKAIVCERGGRVAVAVKATPPGDTVPAVYRMLCVRCGNESPWFELAGDATRIVADAPTSPTLPVAAEAMDGEDEGLLG